MRFRLRADSDQSFREAVEALGWRVFGSNPATRTIVFRDRADPTALPGCIIKEDDIIDCYHLGEFRGNNP